MGQNREYLTLRTTTVKGGDLEVRKRGGRKITRKENLEQRTKLYSIFPPQLASNCSLVLAKGKTES